MHPRKAVPRREQYATTLTIASRVYVSRLSTQDTPGAAHVNTFFSASRFPSRAETISPPRDLAAARRRRFGCMPRTLRRARRTRERAARLAATRPRARNARAPEAPARSAPPEERLRVRGLPRLA